jgi:RHS repeat-associated protein
LVARAENGQVISSPTHAWMTMTTQSGYSGTAYLQALPDLDALEQASEITGSPRAEHAVYFTTPGTYTLWLRGYPANAAGDSAWVGLDEPGVGVTGFAPGDWTWQNRATNGATATLVVEASGLYTLSLHMREDGLRVDRLLLVTDTAYTPAGFGPAESGRQAAGGPGVPMVVDRVIDYGYDDLYRLTSADYSTGEAYAYDYDPAGNRLGQSVNGEVTSYQYDAANRLTAVDGQPYTWDANSNLLSTGVMTNTWDAANRLVAATRGAYTLEPVYNGAGDRVAQTAGLTTTYFALDVQGLPEVIYTSDGDAYLHLPGVIVAESASGERRYLLSDGLGSVRQATDEDGQVVAYHEFDPYGVPVQNGGEPYGFTGEWWEDQVDLLHLRARWYDPDIARFLTQDAWQGDYRQPMSMNPYLYSLANPANFFDPSGHFATNECDPPFDGYLEGISLSFGGSLIYLEQVALGQRQFDEVLFTYSIATEWVYDFVDKQWAVFMSWSQTADVSLGASLGTTHYQGTIDGFRTVKPEAEKAEYIDAYSGPFWVHGFNVGVSVFNVHGFGHSESTATTASQYATTVGEIVTTSLTVAQS